MTGQDIGLATLQTIVLAAMLFGLFGLLIPIIPGLVIIWVAALAYGILTGFHWIAIVIMVVLTLLMGFGSIIDNIIMAGSARKEGASWLAITAAVVLGMVGSIVLPPLGGVLFALVGIFAVEMLRVKDWKKALTSTKSMALGCGWSVVVRFGIGVAMILLWAAWAFLVPPA